MCRSRAGAARRARGCAPMSPRIEQPPFTSRRPALPARSVRPLPLSLPLFFLLLTALFPLSAQLSSPLPSKDGPEGERLPLALRPADGKGFPAPPPRPPLGEFLSGDLRWCRGRSSQSSPLCSNEWVPRVCRRKPVWAFGTTSCRVPPT